MGLPLDLQAGSNTFGIYTFSLPNETLDSLWLVADSMALLENL